MANNSLRVPPQNLDAEKAVLGSIMLRPGTLSEIADGLAPDAFYSEKHKKIYEAMLELYSKNDPIDLVSLTHLLKQTKRLDTVGGARYLTELSQAVPSSTNASYYADIVGQKYILRRLITSADSLAELAYDAGTKPLEEILDEAEREIFAIAEGPKQSKYLTLKDTLGEAWTRLEKLHENKGKLRGVPTGFKPIDDILSGFQPSDLIILAARPSVGKTSFALDIARLTATKHDVPVAIFSLEMSSQQLVDRMLAAESKVNAWKLRTGNLSADSEFGHLRDSLDRLSKAPIYIDDQPSSSIVHIRSVARRLKAEHNIGFVIIDYLQLMTTSKNYDSMVNQVTEISRSLKALARELDVPVLALSQLSRAVEARGGKPRLSDLRDSGSIEQDADIVMFLHREREETEKGSGKSPIVEIMIEKHRNGPTGKVDLYFDEKTTSFMPMEKTDGLDAFSAQKASSADDFANF